MKKNIILFVAAVIALAGCSDFLDIRTEGSMPSSGIDYSKPENIFLPVSAAYASMRMAEGEAQNYIAVMEVTSDDADKGSSEADGPTVAEFDNFTYGPGNNHISAVWTIFYNIVSAANYAIESMDLYKEAITSEDGLLQVEQCRSEAKVIRAYAYWNLVRLFGTVPLIDKTMSATELASQGVATTAQLYTFIYNDLDDAIEGLPNVFPDYKTRYNKYTALALKSKVALYNKDWAEAARCADLVIASGRYSLQSRFADAFAVEYEGGSESLMEIESSALRQTSDPLPVNYYAFIQGPRGNKEPFQGWGYKVPSQKLISWMDGRGDAVRRKVTVLERGANETDEISSNCINPYYNGKVYTPREWNTRSYNAYGLEHNQRLLRYSDVLLIFAEAMVNGAGITPESGYTADQALNEVRGRAGLGPVAANIDNILDERRAELALEENRFFDLVRTGKAQEVLGPLGYTAKNAVFPIPSAQMELNPNLPKTPGYTY
ncbi:MAG: RagB/SusD family nutrient uptake outer membrane protein [Bacteroidales bacterium]|nr:RagB/SusD family nutrient uptake outer membrane protein [Bacteroidales bacterium]